MNLRIGLIALSMGGLLVSFQNCSSKVGFHSADSSTQQSLSTTDGTPPSSPPGDPKLCVDDGDNSQSASYYSHSSSASIPQAQVSCHHLDTPPGSHDDCNDDTDSDLVACILVDHGKSLKLGLVGGALEGVNDVSESVCISKAECLGDVAKAFQVLGAYDRGYCDHNPNVTQLTDAQVKALLPAPAP